MTALHCVCRPLSMLLVVTGVLLCLMGQHGLTWLVMDTESSGVVPKNSSVVAAGMNPWFYWAELSSGKRESHDFVGEKLVGTEWLEVVRIFVTRCVFGALCSLLVLCLSCKRFVLFIAGFAGIRGRHRVAGGVPRCAFRALCSLLVRCLSCNRVFLFIAGLAGFMAAGTGGSAASKFYMKTDTLTESLLGFPLTSYGWAFYVFCAGVGAMGLASILACFPCSELTND